MLFGVRKADGLKLMTSDEVVVDTYGGQVTFHSVKKSDEGRYACEAINDAGSDTGYIQLRVLGKMIIEAIIVIIIIIIIITNFHATQVLKQNFRAADYINQSNQIGLIQTTRSTATRQTHNTIAYN